MRPIGFMIGLAQANWQPERVMQVKYEGDFAYGKPIWDLCGRDTHMVENILP